MDTKTSELFSCHVTAFMIVELIIMTIVRSLIINMTHNV